MAATSQRAHPDPTAPSVQPTQQPTPLTSSSITIPSTISTMPASTTPTPTMPASPTPTPRSYIPTPQSFFVDTSTAYDIINGTTYFLTYTDLVYGTLHIPYIPPSTTATETASGATLAIAVTQGMTSGGNRNAAAASVTPAITDTEISLGSVVPKGMATWAVSTQRSGGGGGTRTGRGRRGSRRWEWLAGWVVGGWASLWGFELIG